MTCSIKIAALPLTSKAEEISTELNGHWHLLIFPPPFFPIIKKLCSRATVSSNALTGGWLRTGDRGRLDAEGQLWLVGRMKDVIRSGSENVSAAEVEQATACQQQSWNSNNLKTLRRAIKDPFMRTSREKHSTLSKMTMPCS